MQTKDKVTLVIIAILIAFALMTLFWSSFGESIDREELQLGLDLEGGAHLVYEADFSELPDDATDDDRKEALSGVIAVLEKRINTYGVSEPVIQKIGDDRILIQIPGIDDLEEAKNRIGETALIRFKEFIPYTYENPGTPVQPNDPGSPADSSSSQPDPETSDVTSAPEISITSVPPPQATSYGSPSYFAQLLDEDGMLVLTEVPKEEAEYKAIPAMAVYQGKTLELTSQYFSGKVEVTMPQNAAQINFEWNDIGSDLFYSITSRLSTKPEGSVERRLGIFVGDVYESAPHVNEPIREDGRITGMSLDEARDLASFLNAGRIEVPLHTLEQHSVDPTLGEDFIKWSKQAGIIGLLLIILFLILYYRIPGLVAGIALLIYSALVLSIYQLWPITLTLAGIAGFILSIGMAVDANVLIFERMKEELRAGRTLRASVELGFNRAWPAIRDGNISTLITCFILGFMGSKLGAPSVEGFAWTLGIGVIVSLFSAVVVTRTFLRLLGITGIVNQRALYISAMKEKMLSGEGR